MKGQLVKDLGFIGDTKQCEAILNGIYSILHEVDPYTAEYIKALAKLASIINASKLVILTATFIEGWKKIREMTSARLSGIHFGHLKVYAILEELADLEATICYIPYATRYSPEEWRLGINIMIEKKGKSNLVTDLRTINLIKVDFNYANKVIAREIL